MWQTAASSAQHSVACVTGRFKEKGRRGSKVDVWQPLGTCYAIAQNPNPMFLTNSHVVRAPRHKKIEELAIVGIVNGNSFIAGASIRSDWPDIDMALLEASREAASTPVVVFNSQKPDIGAPVASIGFPLPGDPVLTPTGGNLQLIRRFSAGFLSSPDVPLQLEGDPAPFEHFELNLFSYGGHSGAPCFGTDALVVATNRGTHVHGKTSAAFAVAVPAPLVIAKLAAVGVGIQVR